MKKFLLLFLLLNTCVMAQDLVVPNGSLLIQREHYCITDSSLILLTLVDFVKLLEQYQTYCDTVKIIVPVIGCEYYDLTEHKMKQDTNYVEQDGTFMCVEGFLDWLKNVKLLQLQQK